jgi:hypothetical protein
MPRFARGAAFFLSWFGSAWNPEIAIRPHFARARGKVPRYAFTDTHWIRELSEMRRMFFVGAFALALFGLLSQLSVAAHASDFASVRADGGDHLAAVDIGRIKSVLKLNSAQQAYWAPVEAALRDLSRQQAPSKQDGFVHRISHRVISVVLDSAAIERLAVAARPLIVALNDEQKQAARTLAHDMGLGPVVAALN